MYISYVMREGAFLRLTLKEYHVKQHRSGEKSKGGIEKDEKIKCIKIRFIPQLRCIVDKNMFKEKL